VQLNHGSLLAFFTISLVVWGSRFGDTKKSNHLFLDSLAASLMLRKKKQHLSVCLP